MEDDKKKYIVMENVFQYINKKHVSLDDAMKKQHNIYQVVVKTLIENMKNASPLFKVMYRELFYGGSYYDGLKISKPEEYDLDLLMKLPEFAKPELTPSDLPGFVRVQLTNLELFKAQPEYTAFYGEFPKLLDADRFLDAGKVKVWMESLIITTLNKFEKCGDQWVFTCEELKSQDNRFFVKMRKAGPAFTLNITSTEITMDVDLVPCFVFNNKWPTHCNFKKNPCSGEPLSSYFIVPKAPKSESKNNPVGRCWRMSFQIQERELIKGKENLKPALKLMKKLRDKCNHKSISSYFLKTIFIFQTQVRDNQFWCSNLPVVYMEMLKVYVACLENKTIPYYWNEKHNMIGHLTDIQLSNIKNQVKKIIGTVERTYATDPFIAASFLVSAEDLAQMKEEVTLGKKALVTSVQITQNKAPLSLTELKKALPEIDTVDGRPNKMARAQSLGPQLNSVNQSSGHIEKQLELIMKHMDTIHRNQDRMLFKMNEISDRLSIVERKLTDNDDNPLVLNYLQ